MIRLEQIRLLETKVNKAVELIKVLREENKTLKDTLDASQDKMQELEKMVEEFKDDQQEIEQYILKALKHLDHLEDEVTGPVGKKGSGADTAAQKPAALKPAAQKPDEPMPEEPAADPGKATRRQKESEDQTLAFDSESGKNENQELEIF